MVFTTFIVTFIVRLYAETPIFKKYHMSSSRNIHKHFSEKVFWKCTANSQENTYAEVWFQ